MDREQILAAMESLLAKAQTEGRDLTAEEQARYDELSARVAGLDNVSARRSGLAALRQQTADVAEQIERAALAPNQQLASIYQRPRGVNARIGDVIRAHVLGGGLRAEQSSTSGAAGGFTVTEYQSAELLDLARAQSRMIQAGARTLPIAGATSFATIEEDPTYSNHGQNQSIDETTIVFGQRNFKPQTLVALISASVELVEDSANFNDAVDSVLAAAFAVQLDSLALNGSGVGTLLGLLNTPGLASVSAAATSNWQPFARAVQSVRSNNYEPGAFILSPGGLGHIDQLVDTTGQPLARPPSIANAQFLDTTSIEDEGSPAGTQAVTGQFDQYFFALRTPLTIEATRVGGDAFNKLQVLIRAYARVDGFAVRKEAFAKVTSIPVPA